MPTFPVPSSAVVRRLTVAAVLGALLVAALVRWPLSVSATPEAQPIPCLSERQGRELFIDYTDPKPVRSFPADQWTIQGWIDNQDMPSIRAHAWDIWESITARTRHGVPAWETWYSGQDVFGGGEGVSRSVRDFEAPTQFHKSDHVSGVPSGERATSFNRYTVMLAGGICTQNLQKAATLNEINDRFDQANAPLSDRYVTTSRGDVEAMSIATKPVFQFIDGDKPTAVPYWAGMAPGATTNALNPEPHTWRQCVVFDPTGRLRPGTTHVMECNEEPARAWPVVSLDTVYHFRLTQVDVDEYSQFALTSSDIVGRGNQTDVDSVKAAVQPGNVALLMAMHVTTKEIPNWTWQTYWWSPSEREKDFGDDKPRTLQRPWSHYNMLAAYYMTTPPTDPNGQHLVVFNPYLETNLTGTFTGANNRQISWTGVTSNCMSCHALATWKRNPQAGQSGQGPGASLDYRPSGLIRDTDGYFEGYTRLDFLWSITRAQ